MKRIFCKRLRFNRIKLKFTHFSMILVFLGCGVNTKTDSNEMSEFILTLLGGANLSPNQVDQSPMAQEDINTPIFQNPPDEVIATNPPPPPQGEVVPKTPDGSIPISEIGPRLEVRIDSLDYSSAERFDFLSRQVNTHEDKIVTIENTGDKILNISQINVVGSSSQFQRISGFSGGNIPVGENRSFTIRFTPNGAGLRSGELNIRNNDSRIQLGHQANMADFTLRLRGAGTMTPTATVLKTPTSVSRFQRIVIEFSHEMDRGTICNNAMGIFGNENYSHRSGGNQLRFVNTNDSSLVGGRCIWTGLRQLVLQPYTALDSLTSYRIEMDDALVHSTLSGTTPDDKLHCLGLPSTCNTNRRVSFATEAKFEANLSINGKLLTGSSARGLVINSTNHPVITLTGIIGENISASSICIKKLGAHHSSCGSWNGIDSVNLSNITPADLRPTQGSNGYFIEIKSGGKIYIRNFGFNYGTPQVNPTTSPVLAGGRVNIGTGGFGVGQLQSFLNKFFLSNGSMQENSGNFRLDNKILREFSLTPRNASFTNGSNIVTISSSVGIQVGMTIIPTLNTSNTDFLLAPIFITERISSNQFRVNRNLSATRTVSVLIGPVLVKTGSSMSGNNITLNNMEGIEVGMLAYGIGVPENSKIMSITGNSITINKNVTSSSSNFISFSKSFIQSNLTRFSIDAPSVTDEGDCLPASEYPDFLYLKNFGPFCNIDTGLFGIRANVYVKELHLERFADGGSLNLTADLNPTGNNLGLILKNRRLYGKLKINVSWIIFVGRPVVDVDFVMNRDGSLAVYPPTSYASSPIRNAITRNVLNIITGGAVNISILNPGNFGTISASGSPPCQYSNDLNVCEWSDDISVFNLNQSQAASWGGLVGAIIDNVIPRVQWRIVQGIIRDTVQTVAPNVLNALFSQLRIEAGDTTPNGIGVNLPNYLPDPFNRTKLYIGANLRQNSTNRTGADGLDLGADIGILSCMNPNSSTDTCLPSTDPTPGTLLRPELHTGSGFSDSFMLSGGNNDASLPRSQLANATVNANNGTGLIANHPGVLLAVKLDVINQVLYNLWKKGTFELSLDQNFANQVRAYRGDSDRLFQIFQILLKADAILRVIAPGQTDVFYGPGTNDKINRDDDIIFKLKPFSPPNLKPSPLSISKVITPGRRFALGDIEWSDLFIEVWGRRSDNSEYKVTTLKINFRSRAAMNIHKFSSPVNSNSNNYQNVTSVQLNVCDDNVNNPSSFDCDELRITNYLNDDLVYSMEVLDNPVDNPLGLDPRGIYEVLNPSVQKLILPVVNFVLEELPLEEKSFSLPPTEIPNEPGSREDPNHPNNKIMANCGLRLDNMSVQPIPETETSPYILIHTELKDYIFSGNCQL
ncbi:MAG: choice-of-anchor D domain-containing protein [Leptospira sp.]|nr:choice-of-anchor D domain-containing protein [Leptospira sp.]